MRGLLMILFLGAGVATGAVAAQWSPVLRMSDASSARWVGVAADARGDAAVVWAVASGARPQVGGVRVAVRRGDSGAWTVHLLRSTRNLSVGGVALVVAPDGEVTVAWADQAGSRPPAVRAAYLTPAGRWSRVQVVGRVAPFTFSLGNVMITNPRLAVASDGTVALVYNADIHAAPGMAAAWRWPGHPFGPIAAVPGGQLSEPTLAFDSSGRAFLAGTALCENEGRSHGVMLTAPARSHRFGKPRTITPHPATEVRFALTGRGHGVAAWLDAGCSTSELLSGSVSARTVSMTSSGPVTAVASPYANDLQIIGAPGGFDLTFTGYSGHPLGAVFVAHVNADGTPQTPQVPADGWMPIGADAAGDQVLQTVVAQNVGVSQAVAARAADSTTVDPSTLTGPGYWTAAGSSTGRTLIAAGTLQQGIQVATWMP